MSSLDASLPSLDTILTKYGALPEQWAKDNLVSACSSCGQCFCPNHSPGILSDFQTEMKEQDEEFLDNMTSFPSVDSADIVPAEFSDGISQDPLSLGSQEVISLDLDSEDNWSRDTLDEPEG
jgi:hypothetical protein